MSTTMTLPTGFPPLSSSTITIGLKLEFLITRLPRGHASDTQHEHEHERSATTLISTALTPLCTALRIPPPHHSHIPTTTHTTFTIKRTTPAQPPPPASHPATTIALTTPILPYSTYARVLHATCTAITTAGANVSCSRTHTGLHVHVGLLGRRYTLDELQRLAKAIIIFEARMDAHHADGDGDGDGDGDYTQMQSCIGSAALRGLDVRGRLAAVDDARSYLALCAVMNTGRLVGARRAEEMSSRFYKYNFEAVGRYGTVEFRQAAGTVDAVWIEDWVERVVRFVVAAVRTEDDVFRGWAMVEGGPDDPVVLERFGIGELRESAARRRRRRRGVESAARGLEPGVGRCGLLAVPYPELPDPEPWTPELPVLTPSSTLPRKPRTTIQNPIEPDTTSPDPHPKPKTSTQKPVVVRDITYPNLQIPNPNPKRNPAHPQETHKTTTTATTHPPPSTLPDRPKAAPTSSTRPKIPIPKFKRRPFPLRPTKRLPTAACPSREAPVMSKPDPRPGGLPADAGAAACVRGGSSSGSSVSVGGFLGVSGASGGEVGEVGGEGEEDEEEEEEEEEDGEEDEEEDEENEEDEEDEEDEEEEDKEEEELCPPNSSHEPPARHAKPTRRRMLPAATAATGALLLALLLRA